MSFSNTNTNNLTFKLNNLGLSQEEVGDFINQLIISIFGYSLIEIPEEKRENSIKKSLQLFDNYMNEYILLKYGRQEQIRFKASINYQDLSVYEKFPELKNLFIEAYQSFLQTLANSWNK